MAGCAVLGSAPTDVDVFEACIPQASPHDGVCHLLDRRLVDVAAEEVPACMQDGGLAGLRHAARACEAVHACTS